MILDVHTYLRLGDGKHGLQSFQLGGVPQKGLAAGSRRPLDLSRRLADVLELLQILGILLDLLLRVSGDRGAEDCRVCER